MFILFLTQLFLWGKDKSINNLLVAIKFCKFPIFLACVHHRHILLTVDVDGKRGLLHAEPAENARNRWDNSFSCGHSNQFIGSRNEAKTKNKKRKTEQQLEPLNVTIKM